MLRVLIVDDEVPARRGLARLLGAHADVTVVGAAADIPEALEIIARETPDVVFLDIEFGPGEESGFDLITRLETPPRIVCVTAHALHAVEAFAVEAVDFLLKPVAPERLSETLARLSRRGEVDPEPRPLTLRTPGRTVVVAPREIAAIRADGDFSHVLIADQPPLMILRTLRAFETLLPTRLFLRVDRSLILNLDRVQAIETGAADACFVRLAGLEAPVPLGRSAAARLRAALDARTGAQSLMRK